MKIISTQTLKDFLEKTDTKHDVLLDTLIKFYSKRIETFMNRELKYGLREMYFNAGRRKFTLPAYPIDVNVTPGDTGLAVYDCGVLQLKDSWYWVWASEGIVEFYAEPMYIQPRQLKFIWTGGYREVTVNGETYFTDMNPAFLFPDDVKLATMVQCAYVFRRRNDIGLQSVNMPDGTISKILDKSSDLIPMVKNMLMPHRRIPDAY